jgi:predicted permease
VNPATVVLGRIAVVLVLVALGWAARRLRVLDGDALASLSRLVVDVAFPALVFTQLLRTVDRASLAAEWFVPAAAFAMLAGGWWGARRLGSRTAAFCVGLPNWVFLPLLIAEALYGAAGTRTVLLFNAGAQVALWTVGVRTLQGRSDAAALVRIPGLWATAAGVALALLIPGAARPPAIPAIGLEALTLLGSLAVPLSMCVTGATLAEVPLGRALRPDAELLRILAGRMIAAPLVVGGALWAAGAALEPRVRVLLLLIAAMPVAVNSAVHARRFGGDADLAARAVLWSTVASLATVPFVIAVLS